ncbi:MAG: hypothetical protein J5367_01200 [Lachnospiraceae bacterium]|nr:hypothetical protein [Lachnospiraceae bacterium]
MWVCYDECAVIPSGRKEVIAINILVDLILAVVAGIVTYYICKWLDGE